MDFSSKSLVLVFHVWLLCQNTLAQTIVGMSAQSGGPPQALVSIDPNTCDITTISQFDNGGTEVYYLFDNAGWVDQSGFYYANYLTTTSWWGPGTTFIFDLNSPGSWSSFGQTTFTALAESSAGDVYAVGTAGQGQCIGVSVSAGSQSESTVGSFPVDYGPTDTGASTVDGNGIFWSWFADSSDYDWWIGMDTSTGQITQRSEMWGGWPVAMDIHYDATNDDFFSICRVGDSNYMMCKVDPTTTNSVPKSYGVNQTVTMLMTGGVFSPSNRILYVQIFMNPSYENANLFGFDVDSGQEVSNCVIPSSVGGALLNMAVY